MVHAALTPAITEDDIALRSAQDAYLFYAGQRNYPIEFGSNQLDELATWSTKVFKRKFYPPKLGNFGYDYLGGKLLPGQEGVHNFYLFADKSQNRIAVVLWPRKLQPQSITKYGKTKLVQIRYWGANGFGFAVMFNSKNDQIESVTRGVASYYREFLNKKAN